MTLLSNLVYVSSVCYRTVGTRNGGGAQILVEIIEAKPIPLSIRFLRRPKKLLTLLNNPMTMIEI